MRYLYRGALVLWLLSGFAMHAYFSRADQGTAGIETKPGVRVQQAGSDGLATRTAGEARSDARMRTIGAYAAWVFFGFVLALHGVHLLFRKADRVADIERFLAASLLLTIGTAALAPASSGGEPAACAIAGSTRVTGA